MTRGSASLVRRVARPSRCPARRGRETRWHAAYCHSPPTSVSLNPQHRTAPAGGRALSSRRGSPRYPTAVVARRAVQLTTCAIGRGCQRATMGLHRFSLTQLSARLASRHLPRTAVPASGSDRSGRGAAAFEAQQAGALSYSNRGSTPGSRGRWRGRSRNCGFAGVVPRHWLVAARRPRSAALLERFEASSPRHPRGSRDLFYDRHQGRGRRRHGRHRRRAPCSCSTFRSFSIEFAFVRA